MSTMPSDSEGRIADAKFAPAPPASSFDAQAELAAVRNQNVILTRELGVLRWQFAKLLEQQPPIRAGMIRTVELLQRKFPGPVEKIARIKRLIRGRLRVK